MPGQIERIRIFLEVADQNGFAAGARVLGLSPTIVTRQVAELEVQLGVQLFVRTTRKISLTHAGSTYYQRVRPIVDDLNFAAEEVRQQQGTLSGPLTVSAPLSLGMQLLPDVIAQFRILYPEVKLNLQLSDRFIDILTEGFDMALRISGPPKDKSTIWRKICRVPRIMVAAPDYLSRHLAPKHPDELHRHNCLNYGEQTNNDTWWLSLAQKTISARLQSCLTCNNGNVLAQLAIRGEGIALLPTFIVADALEIGQLTQVLADWLPPEIWLTAYYPPYDRLPAKVAAFSDFIEAAIKDNGIYTSD